MANKATTASLLRVVPIKGIDQRQDIAVLDDQTLSFVEGLIPSQTGMLSRCLGKATLFKYANAVWGVHQMWTPVGLVAGLTQFNQSLGFEPWKVTWNPISIVAPTYLPVDYDTNVTLPAVTSTSIDSSSGIGVEGSGVKLSWHWEYTLKTMTYSGRVSYKGDVPDDYHAVGTAACPVSTPAPYALAEPNPVQAQNYHAGMYAYIAQQSSAGYSSCSGSPPTATLYYSHATQAAWNILNYTITDSNAELPLWVGYLTGGTGANPTNYHVEWTSIPVGEVTGLDTRSILTASALNVNSTSSSYAQYKNTAISDDDSSIPASIRGKYRTFKKVILCSV